ncbi:MAG: glycerophosphodiester phosphodiesterase family protein [Alphaproteobacteria bacterium]
MIDTESAPVSTVIGHRGAAGHAPENTLASLEKAAGLGVRWVEFDTKLTADGHVVLFHDDTLERTTGGRGTVAETTLADLRALDAGSWFDAAYAGQRVPTLKEAMETLARLDLGAVVEIKPSPGRERETGLAVAGGLAAAWPETLPAPLIASFDPTALGAARDAAPNIRRALNVFKIPRGWRKRAKALNFRAVHCLERNLTARRVRVLKDEGMVVRAFTVNDRTRAEALLRWGVDGVFSDYPERMPQDNR